MLSLTHSSLITGPLLLCIIYIYTHNIDHVYITVALSRWCVTSSPLVLGLDLRDPAAVDLAWPIISNKAALEVNRAWPHPMPGRMVGTDGSWGDGTVSVPVQYTVCVRVWWMYEYVRVWWVYEYGVHEYGTARKRCRCNEQQQTSTGGCDIACSPQTCCTVIKIMATLCTVYHCCTIPVVLGIACFYWMHSFYMIERARPSICMTCSYNLRQKGA